MTTLLQNVWFRVGVVAALVTLGVIFSMPAPARSAIALKATYYSPAFLLALTIGAGAGFLFWSRRVWFWASAICVALAVAATVII